ncbi:hypothetical protein BJ322DRAFT_1109526 [Thelephora terrestris]|nr:hypothetical protein BJ322DRAFT_1109526 [Thelephora terrestris]
MPHCEGIPGTWNTVMPTDDDGGFYRAIRLPGNLPSDVLLTEDSLVVIKRGFYHGSEPFLTVFSF